MIIDSHTHVYPDKIAHKTVQALSEIASLNPYHDGTLQGLITKMKNDGIDCSIILPVLTSPSQFDSVLKSSAAINHGPWGWHDLTRLPDKSPCVHSFAGIHPDDPDYQAHLRQIQTMGFAGIKLHPDYQKCFIDDSRNMQIIAYAESLQLITVVHAGLDIGLGNPIHCTPKKSAKVIDILQPKRLILAHGGGFRMWDEVEQELLGRSVYLDISCVLPYISKEQFLRMVMHHGDHQILFASDSPWQSTADTLLRLQQSGLTTESLLRITAGNILRLLGTPS